MNPAYFGDTPGYIGFSGPTGAQRILRGFSGIIYQIYHIIISFPVLRPPRAQLRRGCIDPLYSYISQSYLCMLVGVGVGWGGGIKLYPIPRT